MVDKDSQNCSWNEEQLYSEVVNVTAYGALVLDQGQVNVGDTAGNEEDLDASVVQGDEVHEQVEVAQAEHNQIDLLSLARYTYTKIVCLIHVSFISCYKLLLGAGYLPRQFLEPVMRLKSRTIAHKCSMSAMNLKMFIFEKLLIRL